MATSNILLRALNKILASPYITNSTTNPLHEKYILNIFINHGFQEFSSSEKLFNKEEFWKNHLVPNWEKADNIPNNTFIHQPFGSKMPPDFIVKYQGVLIPLECKSAEGTRPAYNGTLPHPNCIYAFTSKKYNKHTLFLGQDVLYIEERMYWLGLEKDIRELIDQRTKEYRKKNPIDKYERGFYLYFRQKWEQQCSHLPCSNDYFKHSDREKCEQAVFAWIKTFN